MSILPTGLDNQQGRTIINVLYLFIINTVGLLLVNTFLRTTKYNTSLTAKSLIDILVLHTFTD